MSLERSVNDLIDEIKKNGQNRKVFIEMKENEILKNFDQIQELQTKNFFKLPIINIFSIISKYDFSNQGSNQFPFLNLIISNIFEEHPKEKEFLYLLKHIHFSSPESDNENLTLEEIINLLTLFKNVDLFQQLSIKFYEKETQLDFDFSYEIEHRDKIISELQANIEAYKIKYLTARYPPITEKPKDLECDIFKACKNGKLSSIRYLIEIEGIDKNIKVPHDNIMFLKDYQPIHIACKNGHLDIVEYLIKKANVDVETHGCYEETALMTACFYGHLDIVKYLIEEAHANKEAHDILNRTPLGRSCESGNLLLVQYLIEDAKVDITKYSNVERSPLHAACENGHLPIVKYLIEIVGFNPNGNIGQDFSPLEKGRNHGRPSIVQYLIETCKVDPNQKN